MNEPGPHRRWSRWSAPSLAFLTAIVLGLLAVVTNIATSTLPESWTWLHNFPLMVSLVGGLLVLAGFLSAWAALPSGSADSGRDKTLLSMSHERDPHAWNVPPRNPLFTGREKLLADLRRTLQQGGSIAVTTLGGMAGVGKTQLVIEYAHRFKDDYSIIWWIPSEDPELLRQRLAELALQLEVASEQDTIDTAIRHLLARLQQVSRWLLIFDNAPGPDSVDEHLSQLAGQVIITSRFQDWVGIAEQITVEPFTQDEATALLKRHSSSLAGAEGAEVADALGRLPLALSQAGAYITQSGLTPREYLQFLNESPLSLMTDAGPASYPGSFAASLELSLRGLNASRGGLELLEGCAFLAPEPVPTGLLVNGGSTLTALRSRHALADALRDIAVRSLAGVDERGLSLHRLTQAVIRELVQKRRPHASDQAERVLEFASPGDPNNPSSWPAWAALSPHLRAVGTDVQSEKVCQLICDGMAYLLARGEIEAAKQSLQRLSADWTISKGGDTRIVLNVRNYLARALSDQGDYTTALQIDEQVYRSRTDMLGPAHDETLQSAYNLGADLVRLGMHDRAIEHNQRTLQQYQEKYKNGSYLTGGIQTLLAMSLAAEGKYSEGARIMRIVGEQEEKIYGPGHPDTIKSKTRLAYYLRRDGQVEDALSIMKVVSRESEQSLGPHHSTTLLALAELSVCLHVAGYRAEAAAAAAKLREAVNQRPDLERPTLDRLSEALKLEGHE